VQGATDGRPWAIESTSLKIRFAIDEPEGRGFKSYQAPQAYLDKYKHIADPTRRALLAGDTDVSKLKLPADNGPYRGGKGTLYEGGTRVVALANWPGRIKPAEVTAMMHVVDMFPTLAGLAGAKGKKEKPLDGLDMWPTLSAGAPSPRQEVVYNIEPFRGGLREGDWKLVWRTPLPSALELYDIPQDPSEKNNLADKYPQKVAALQKRIEALAKESAKSLFLVDAFAAVKSASYGEPVLPTEEAFFTQGD
jgi:arylsulfatase B